MPKRCYVSMPFGTKPISDGTPHDFDWVYAELVEPAVKMADYDPIYLKNFFSNASILDTIIKLVSESEAMIVDITGKNPNVMYELGIRHAFVPTGTLMIQRDDELRPFDLSHFFGYLYPKSLTSDLIPSARAELATALAKICDDPNPNIVYRKARYARQHEEYLTALEAFHAIAPYENSFFIMTKYPNLDPRTQTENDRKLERVIDTVKQTLRIHDLTPRLAADKFFHPILWKNIEVYLLGCSRGIAIVENKYDGEVNPNVAMEWGWMRAAGRDVLYLLDSEFKNERADFTGFLSERFSWDFPEKDIQAAVAKWLPKSGASAP
jgi:hypothetical protein